MMKRLIINALAAVVIVGVVIAGAFYWQLQNSFSTAIRWRADSACANRRPCIFSLGEVLPGKWDRVIVFDMAASQTEIDQAVGEHIPRPDVQRLIVYMQGSKALRSNTEAQGVEHPTSGEVVFERVPVTQNHMVISHGSNFVLANGSDLCDKCVTLSLIQPGEFVE